MRGSRRQVMLAAGAVALTGSIAFGQTSATASEGDATVYGLLAADGASVDAPVAAAQAAGGVVQDVNRAIGLVTVSATNDDFTAQVASQADVSGVARETVIGRAPNDAVQSRDAVEKEG